MHHVPVYRFLGHPLQCGEIQPQLLTQFQKRYMRLAVNLGLKPHDVQISEEDNYRNSGRVLIDIVDLWMRNGIDPKPSWQSLEEALQLTL
jgi:hypothetical protein